MTAAEQRTERYRAIVADQHHAGHSAAQIAATLQLDRDGSRELAEYLDRGEHLEIIVRPARPSHKPIKTDGVRYRVAALYQAHVPLAQIEQLTGLRSGRINAVLGTLRRDGIISYRSPKKKPAGSHPGLTGRDGHLNLPASGQGTIAGARNAPGTRTAKGRDLHAARTRRITVQAPTTPPGVQLGLDALLPAATATSGSLSTLAQTAETLIDNHPDVAAAVHRLQTVVEDHTTTTEDR